MKQSPESAVLVRKRLVVFVPVVLALAGAMTVAFATTLRMQTAYILLPTVATILVFVVFAMILRWRVGDGLFGELGFLYLALAVCYTIIPAFAFMLANVDVALSEKFARISATQFAMGIHLWRHALFVLGVAAGYLLARGHRTIPRLITNKASKGKDGPTIVFLIVVVGICILFLTAMSAPVASYIDNYTRYDHLSWSSRKLVSGALRLKVGLYSTLLTFLFLNYRKYKLIIPVIVAFLVIYEMTYSFGARIESLVILLASLCLYNYTVKRVSLRWGATICIGLAMLFSAVELFRSSDFSTNTAEKMVTDQGLKPASEFFSIYFTGLHLYTERAQGTLPSTEWPMFFYDFIAPFTFADFATRWNPQYWYARNYFPAAVVPPETMGPIAESAIWGGEVDLLLRGLINGAFFAYLVRWFLRRKDSWWGVAIYVYSYATCIMTLKYSIFYILTPLVKTLLPTLLVVEVIRRIIPSRPKLPVQKWLRYSEQVR